MSAEMRIVRRFQVPSLTILALVAVTGVARD